MVASRQQTLSRLKVVLFFLIATILGWQTPGQARGLDLNEQQLAEDLASRAPWQSEHDQKLELHPLGIQTLFAERQEGKNIIHERIARVYQYDYTRRAARLLVINLDQQVTTDILPVDSAHLPLNQTEIQFAIKLLSADAQLMHQLRAEQSARAVKPFNTLSELDVKASIFEPRDSSHPCAASRCALLSLFDASSTVFAMEPVVFLNTQHIGLLQQQ